MFAPPSSLSHSPFSFHSTFNTSTRPFQSESQPPLPQAQLRSAISFQGKFLLEINQFAIYTSGGDHGESRGGYANYITD